MCLIYDICHSQSSDFLTELVIYNLVLFVKLAPNPRYHPPPLKLIATKGFFVLFRKIGFFCFSGKNRFPGFRLARAELIRFPESRSEKNRL